MEKGITVRYSNEVRDETLRRYGITHSEVTILDGFESFIYEFQSGGMERILRVGHSLRRSPAWIAGEVDWINYLVDGGVSAARAVPSLAGRLVEKIDDGRGGSFLATAFSKAQGDHVRNDGWTEGLMEHYGHEIGKMHALSKEYLPKQIEWTRPQWDGVEMLAVNNWLPESEQIALMKFKELKSILDGLPRDINSYGLIHQDAHAGNFVADERGQITFFDFDDCAYSWYANEIAIILFYMLVGVENPVSFADHFMRHFLRGYRSEMPLEGFWLGQIPYFLKLWEIDLYAVIHRSFDVDALDDPWVAGYMQGRKSRIENDVPFLAYDFSTLE